MRLLNYKKQAPSAHVSRFGMCTNGVQFGVGDQAQVFPVGKSHRRLPTMLSASARLLRNVYLLFFINVAEEINQATYKRHHRQA